MGGLGWFRGNSAPALHSKISNPSVLGSRSCCRAQSYLKSALRMAESKASKPWRHKKEAQDPDLYMNRILLKKKKKPQSCLLLFMGTEKVIQ